MQRYYAAPLLCFSFVLAGGAHAACELAPGSGDDTYTCDSGNASGLVDLNGNNRLVLPAGSTGTITGAVTFGAGQDSVLIEGGSLLGTLSQGAGIDDFVMTGGTLNALQQGDGRDTFTMTGGTIVGAFEDGDVAYMSGGSIGRVDMKLDNNLFDMSGGQIIGNLVTGLGRDTILLSGGRIGGNISTSSGNDLIDISGGSLGGQILASFGDDVVRWRGGTVAGAINLGPGDDLLSLSGLDRTALAAPPAFDGGSGNDTLEIDASQPQGGSRFINWEHINLSNGSQWQLDDTLTLGDSDSLAGTLTLGAGSTLHSSTGSVVAVQGNATVLNQGTIDLTSTGAVAGDTFSVAGNYTGDNGQLRLQTVLGADGSASDRLVVTQGSLSGLTVLTVSNLNGEGAATTADGIEVVRAGGGAVSSDGAFALGNSLSAGAYQYYLFKGGTGTDSSNSWYLRSTVVTPASGVAPVVAATAVVEQLPATQTRPAQTVVVESTPNLPTASTGQSIVLYRMEVPLYAALPGVANDLLRSQAGTFHQRYGVPGPRLETASWGRLIGEQGSSRWAGAAEPRYSGRSSGWQAGQDLLHHTLGSGQWQAGVFAGSVRSRGDVKGFHDGWADNPSGNLSLTSEQLGAYWTWLGGGGQYVDAVLAVNRFDGKARSDRGVALDVDGHGRLASLETGLPLRAGALTIEPQAQLIATKAVLDNRADAISQVSFSQQTAWQGRLGVRVAAADEASRRFRPWARLDVRHTFSGQDSVSFGADTLTSQRRSSRADAGVGLTWQMTRAVALTSSAQWGQQLDSQPQHSAGASLGVRVGW